MPDDGNAAPEPNRGGWFAALGAGVGLGALALSGYAFAHRVPTGRITEHAGPATALLGGALALAALVTAALLVVGVRAATGRAVTAQAGLLLTAVSAMTSYAWLASTPDRRLAVLTGPGAAPAGLLTRLSWTLLALAAALTLAAAVTGGHPPRRRTAAALRALPVATVGLLVAVAAGGAGAALATDHGAHLSTAAPIPIPAVPAAVGTDVAYSVPTRRLDFVVPAGPGFIADADGTLVGYDGATGAPRWRLPRTALPDGCDPIRVASTGTAPDAVVIVQCRQLVHPEDRYDPATVQIHLGLDAMTGRLLWSSDHDWNLQGRTLLSPGAVPVHTGDGGIGAVDPRTGALRWTRPSAADCDPDPVRYGTAHTVGYLAECRTGATLHLFDAATGDERTVALPPVPGVRLRYRLAATDGDTVVYRQQDDTHDHTALIAVDTATGAVQTVPGDAYISNTTVWSGTYPGPVLQRGTTRDGIAELYLVATRQSVPATTAHTLRDAGHIDGGLRWALVGATMVTAIGYTDHREALLSVAADGSVTPRPSPCGHDSGGVLPVPGAVLVVCERTGTDGGGGYDILGQR